MNASDAVDRSLALRRGAERYLLTSLICFALSVIIVRLFLELAGYPQIGNATLHIAHVLWGGLLLFIAGLLPLILANGWAFDLSAVLNGVGMGLFIDEVGKFITQTNDYFYPPAAPIIYAFFLLVVLLYLYIRRSDHLTPRQAMYQALHDLGEVLDHDLQADEKAQISARLEYVVRQAPDTNLGYLAQALAQFLQNEALYLSRRPHTIAERLQEKLRQFEQRVRSSWLNEQRFRLLLAFLLLLFAGWALAGLGSLLAALLMKGGLTAYFIRAMRNSEVQSLNALRFTFIRVVLEGGLSVLQLAAAFLLLRGRQVFGLRLAVLSLVMMLTTVDLLVFYLDQFSASITVLAQFGLLLLLFLYRDIYLRPQAHLQ